MRPVFLCLLFIFDIIFHDETKTERYDIVMKLGLSVFSAILLALSLYAVTPGGVQKKFIALNFDTMFNAPSNVFAHAEALNAVTWLDGVAVSLCDVPVKTLDGKTEMSASTKLMQLKS